MFCACASCATKTLAARRRKENRQRWGADFILVPFDIPWPELVFQPPGTLLFSHVYIFFGSGCGHELRVHKLRSETDKRKLPDAAHSATEGIYYPARPQRHLCAGCGWVCARIFSSATFSEHARRNESVSAICTWMSAPCLGGGKAGQGLAVFRAKLAVTWGGYEGNLGGISGSGGAGTGAGKSAGRADPWRTKWRSRWR